MTAEDKKVWQLPPVVIDSMFPIMSFIIANMSMKPLDMPSVPKEETAPGCILPLAGPRPWHVAIWDAEEGPTRRTLTLNSKGIHQECGILRLHVPREAEHPDFNSRGPQHSARLALGGPSGVTLR